MKDGASTPVPRTEAAASPSRTAVALVACALLLHALLAWLAREPGLATRQDDAIYVLLARSLLSGGYHEIFRVDAPIHDQYPPVYPAMLAAWQVAAGDSFDGFIVPGILVSVTTLAILYRGLERTLGAFIAVSAVIVLALNPSLVAFAGGIRSEPLYTLLTVLAIGLLAPAPSRTRTVGLAALMAVAAAMTRSIGLTLVIAVVLFWLWERRWRAAAATAMLAGIVILPWLVFTAMAPEQFAGSSYVAEIRSVEGGTPWIPPIVERIPAVVWAYVSSAVPTHLAVPTIPGTPIDNAVAAAVLWPGLLAGLWSLRTRWRPALLYVLAYGALLAVWVWFADRFVIPLLVVLVPAVLAGLQGMAGRLGRRAGLIAAGAAAAVLAMNGAVTSARLAGARMQCEAVDSMPAAACLKLDQASWMDAVRFVDGNTPRDAVFLSAKPEPLYYYTGRRSVGVEAALAESDAAFIPALLARGAGYVLLGSLQLREPGRMAEALEANCHSLDVVAFFPARTWLFRLRRTEEGQGDGAACDAIARYRAANAHRDFERDP